MNIDEECSAAIIRITYSINANAEFEKKKMMEEFARLREAKNNLQEHGSSLHALYLLQQRAMNDCSHQLQGMSGFFCYQSDLLGIGNGNGNYCQW